MAHYIVKRKVGLKSFTIYEAHTTALRSVFSLQPDTSLHCHGLLHLSLTIQLSLVLTAPTQEGMARLSWPGWLGLILKRHTREKSPILWKFANVC